MNIVDQYGEKRNGFVEVAVFCHVTCRYFNRFLLQGVDRNWRQAKPVFSIRYRALYVRDIGKLILER